MYNPIDTVQCPLHVLLSRNIRMRQHNENVKRERHQATAAAPAVQQQAR